MRSFIECMVSSYKSTASRGLLRVCYTMDVSAEQISSSPAISDSAALLIALFLPHFGSAVVNFLFPVYTPWYKGLKKSKLVPPNWVFTIVWLGLFTGIGYASFVVWKLGGGFAGEAKIPLVLYGALLILNFIYTPVFFADHNLHGAFTIALILLPASAVTGLSFSKINDVAGFLIVPFFIWLAFCTYLLSRIIKYNGDQIDPDKAKIVY